MAALPVFVIALLTVATLPANAQNLNSVYDSPTPALAPGESVVGWVTHDEKLWLTTTDRAFESPFYNGANISLTDTLLQWSVFNVHPNAASMVVPDRLNPDSILLTGKVGFGTNLLYSVTATVVANSLASFSSTAIPLTSGGGFPSGMVMDTTGAVYLSQPDGIEKYPDANTGTPSLTFDANSLGVNALAFGPDGLLYGLNPTAGEVLRFNPSTGASLGGFNLAEAAMSSALAVDNQGRLFTANGNGGGSIYDILTGNRIGTLHSSDSHPSVGNASLLLDGVGHLYLFDNDTGIHVFNVAPEPGTLALLGMAALPIMGMVRRRKA